MVFPLWEYMPAKTVWPLLAMARAARAPKPVEAPEMRYTDMLIAGDVNYV